MNVGTARRVEKPWGHEEILVETDLYRLKILVIRAGEETSVQRHERKHEAFYIDGGVAQVLHGTETAFVSKGHLVVVPPGTVHQILAANNQGVRVIEVSNAVPDSDIERISDRYAAQRGGAHSP